MAIMNEIIKYNEEDLQATWAVFEWLRNKGSIETYEDDIRLLKQYKKEELKDGYA